MEALAIILFLGLVGGVLVYRVERARRAKLTKEERDEEDLETMGW